MPNNNEILTFQKKVVHLITGVKVSKTDGSRWGKCRKTIIILQA